MENIKGQWNFISSKKLERMRGEKKIGTVSFVVVMIGVEFFGEILFPFLLLLLVLFSFFFFAVGRCQIEFYKTIPQLLVSW